jgi:hypothetical protein
MPVYFMPFSFNNPWQFTPLLNFLCLIFGLMVFGLPHSITLTPYL